MTLFFIKRSRTRRPDFEWLENGPFDNQTRIESDKTGFWMLTVHDFCVPCGPVSKYSTMCVAKYIADLLKNMCAAKLLGKKKLISSF
jgi:hypothetical protein